MKLASLSQKGSRYTINQDSIKTAIGLQELHISVLCDGVGGEKSGEVASSLCCEVLTDFWSQTAFENEEIPRFMARSIQNANEIVYEKASNESELSGMATTLVLVLIRDNHVYFDNIGDSRLYLLRENELKQLTDDDSLVWNWYKSGRITKDEIRSSTRKNVITQAIGESRLVELHNYESIQLEPNDKLLLCSDGLTDVLSDEEIQQILSEEKSLESTVAHLLEAALKAETTDDTSVLLIHF